MTPPPAMTTSALSIPGHSPELEDELQSGEGRDIPIVEWRRDLDHVETHRARASQDSPEKVERLPRRHAACRRYLGAGGIRGVKSVDVKRNMPLLPREPVPNRFLRADWIGRQLPRGDEQDASGPNELHLLGVVVPP